MVSKALEEYLKTMYVLKKQNGNVRVTDIANKMNCSKASVNKALYNLKDNNLEVEFSRIHFIKRDKTTQELEKFENPKREYGRVLPGESRLKLRLLSACETTYKASADFAGCRSETASNECAETPIPPTGKA